MMIDDAVAKARLECDQFLATASRAGKDTETAFNSLLKNVERVLAATYLSSTRGRKDAMALEIYKAHREAGPMRQETRISILQKGGMIKEDKVTCPEGCHVFATQTYKVSTEEIMKAGIPVKMLAQGISEFLRDPNLSMNELAGPLKN
jgi:hypothetical protein